MFAPMRILHVNDRLSQRGGADWHLLGVIQAQLRRWGGEAVRLVVGRLDGTWPPPCPTTELAGLDARTWTPVGLEALVDALRPDLVHLHNVVNPWVLTWACSSARPRLMTVQDHRCFCPGRGKWTASGDVCREPRGSRCAECFTDRVYFEEIDRLTGQRLDALRRLPALTVLSSYMEQQLVQVGVPAGRIHVIPPFVHGLDSDLAQAQGLSSPPTRPTGLHSPCALFVGRLVDAKGPADALRAWRESGLDLPMVVAGTGSARERLQQLWPEAELVGWVPHERLAALYRRARVLLMPCRWQEPFGIVGLEAMTMGVPVAAWDSGGVGQWHPGPLIPWGDVEGLGRAAARLAGTRAPPPSGFEQEALMSRLHGLYRRLLAGGS